MIRRIATLVVLVVLSAACVGGRQDFPQPRPVPDLVTPDWSAAELDPASYPDSASLQMAVHQFDSDCHAANGFPSQVMRDGSELGSVVRTQVPPGQEQRFADVSYACGRLRGPDGPPFDDAQIAALYAAEVETAECLLAEDIAVEIPSEAAWRESGRVWNAYKDVSDDVLESSIEERCPPPDPFRILQGD